MHRTSGFQGAGRPVPGQSAQNTASPAALERRPAGRQFLSRRWLCPHPLAVPGQQPRDEGEVPMAAGNTYKQCGCRGEDGTRLGSAMPETTAR